MIQNKSKKEYKKFKILSVALVNLVNKNTVDIPIDRRVLEAAKRAEQHHYRMRRPRKRFEIVQ